MLLINFSILIIILIKKVLLTNEGEKIVNCINSDKKNKESIIKKFEMNFRTNKKNFRFTSKYQCCSNIRPGQNKKIIRKFLVERLNILKNKVIDDSLEIFDLTKPCDIAKFQKLEVYYSILSCLHVIINNLAELKLLNLENKLSFKKIDDINHLANYDTEVLNVFVNLDKNLLNEKIDDLPENVKKIDEQLSNFISFKFKASYLDNHSIHGKDEELDRIGELSDYSDLLRLYFYHLRNNTLNINDLKDITIYLILFLNYDSLFFKIQPERRYKNFLILKMILILKISENDTIEDVEKIICYVKDNTNENFFLFMNVFRPSSSFYDEIESGIKKSLEQKTYLGPLKILDHFQTYSILKPACLSLKKFFFVLEDDECDSLHALQNDLFRNFEYLFDLISNKIY